MRCSRSLAALGVGAFVFITAAPPSLARQNNSTGTFGQVTYTTPAGWKARAFAAAVSFEPLDLPAADFLAVQR
jgi:hypothetical protein